MTTCVVCKRDDGRATFVGKCWDCLTPAERENYSSGAFLRKGVIPEVVDDTSGRFRALRSISPRCAAAVEALAAFPMSSEMGLSKPDEVELDALIYMARRYRDGRKN